jgi:hypothetical protein
LEAQYAEAVNILASQARSGTEWMAANRKRPAAAMVSLPPAVVPSAAAAPLTASAVQGGPPTNRARPNPMPMMNNTAGVYAAKMPTAHAI